MDNREAVSGSSSDSGASYPAGRMGPDTRVVKAFKDEFIDCFLDFSTSMDVLVNGRISHGDEVIDHVGREGIGITAAVVTGVLSVLAAVGVMGSAMVAYITIPITIIGLLGAFIFKETRDWRKKKQYERAEIVLQRDDIDADCRKMADLFVELFQVQLRNCTVKDAVKLARVSYQIISNEMLNNPHFSFEELLLLPSLTALLMRANQSVPAQTLDLNLRENRSCTTRDMLISAAIYCEETNRFYVSEQARPRQSGALYFKTEDELCTYVTMMKQAQGGRSYRYRVLYDNEVKLLQRESLFSDYKNDQTFGLGKRGVSSTASILSRLDSIASPVADLHLVQNQPVMLHSKQEQGVLQYVKTFFSKIWSFFSGCQQPVVDREMGLLPVRQQNTAGQG